MDTYEILNCESTNGGYPVGTIEHHSGSGGAVLKLAGGQGGDVLYFANIDTALHAVRHIHGYPNAFLQKTKAA